MKAFGDGAWSDFHFPKVPPPGGLTENERKSTLTSPEAEDPLGYKSGVSDGVLDVLVAEIVLQGSGIVSIVGKFIAARMPQHVRMQRERHLCGLAEPLDEMVEADGVHWSAALRDEDVSLVPAFTAELA